VQLANKSQQTDDYESFNTGRKSTRRGPNFKETFIDCKNIRNICDLGHFESDIIAYALIYDQFREKISLFPLYCPSYKLKETAE
jgi:hypothetical protein